jgi:hypothetical protein
MVDERGTVHVLVHRACYPRLTYLLVAPDDESGLREQLEPVGPGNDQEETQQAVTSETRHETLFVLFLQWLIGYLEPGATLTGSAQNGARVTERLHRPESDASVT